jgi:hypothetical protein
MADESTTQYDARTLCDNLAAVEQRIEQACDRAGRSADEVTLIAVSKTHPVEAIEALYEAGHRDFGESYVQEWQDKAAALPKDIVWHFIGHLQSNKAKYIADEVAMVHSVDRKSVMKQLNRRSDERVDVLLQVNIAGQGTKSGVAPDGLIGLLELTRNYPSMRVRGLMTIPPYVENPEENRGHFQNMRELFERAKAWLQENASEDADAFEHLSMGMTGDFEVAIEEGATIVRVGTGIFGQRDYS